MAYCQEMPVNELIDPFLSGIARMVNRHCHNATACRLQKPVTFTVHNVVLLDNYPRRTNRAVDFKFFVVLPPDAVPIDKKIAKPLLSSKILAVRRHIHQKDGWLVDQQVAKMQVTLRRTLEIIQEQKYHQEQERRLQMAIERKQALAYRTALAETGKGELIPNPGNSTTAGATVPINNISIESSETQEYDEDGNVPEIVIMHARDSSRETLDLDNPYNQRKISHTHGRGKGNGRRLSSVDDIKRKQRHSIFGGSSRPDRQKRWKTGSLMLSHLGSKDGK
uniref:Uncharacterized protein n=1 Tax=Panagrolaimus sp. ES5 TaxID=591445 RepID=A0AC34GVR2_9BILA